MTPYVSIIFPIYNTASYLKEAVDSILNQTFTDFELIALNDCSPDNADEILNQYNDNRIVRYKGINNVGLANILNTGIRLAKGKYIARMDSDDISHPDRLKIEIEYLETHPEVDLVSCGMQEFGCGNRTYSYDGDLDYLKFTSFLYTPILHASSVWRRDSFLKHDLFFNQNSVPAEDYDLWTRALTKGLYLQNIPNILYYYRIFDGQATSNKSAVNNAVENVKRNYVTTLFNPDNENTIQDIVSIDNYARTSPDKLKKAITSLIAINKSSNYINSEKLEIYTKQYLKQSIYSYLYYNGMFHEGLFSVGIRNILKLIKHEIFHNNTGL